MQVRELLDLARFLKTFLQDHRLAAKYQELIPVVKQMAQSQNPEAVQTAIDEILEIHRNAEKHPLSPAQIQLISEFGGDGLIGQTARVHLEEILHAHRFSPQGLGAALQDLLTRTNELQRRSEQLISSLEPMIADKSESPETVMGEGTLWLRFEQSTDVQTIGDLEDAAEMWKEVLHHFSRMPDATAEGGRIIYIQKSSPLEALIAAPLAVLVPMAFGITYLLSRVQQVILILQQAEQLKQMKVKTRIIKALRKDAIEKRKAIVAEAADTVQVKFGADAEARNAVQVGLTKVLKFIEKGGVLDIDSKDVEAAEPDQVDDGPKPEGIRDLIATVRAEMKALAPLTRGTQNLLAEPDDDGTVEGDPEDPEGDE